MQERDQMRGKKAGVILCGGNIDTEWFVTVMQGGVPKP
jgi:threonine dehydratase